VRQNGGLRARAGHSKYRPDQAIEALERAIRLSPLDPWGAALCTSPLAMAHLAAG